MSTPSSRQTAPRVAHLLRPYQQLAVNAAMSYTGHAGLIVMPTGTGKSIVLAEITRQLSAAGKRVLVATHVKELVEQDRDACLSRMPTKSVGVVAAGLSSYQFKRPVTVAMINTVKGHLARLGQIDVVIVDECHRIPNSDRGMYGTLLTAIRAKNPRAQLIGLSATPFRTSTGRLDEPYGNTPAQFENVIYELPILPLVPKYLAPLTSTGVAVAARFNQFHDSIEVVSGEYTNGSLGTYFSEHYDNSQAVTDVLSRAAGRKSILVFASSVEHANTLAGLFRAAGETAEVVLGETPSDERADRIARFKAGTLRVLINRDVLTTGFDAPGTDCLVMLRPTKSPGLYVQMLGRGMRLSPGTGKVDCLVLDYAGLQAEHGSITAMTGRKEKSASRLTIDRTKPCPSCDWDIPVSARVCPYCDYRLPVSMGPPKFALSMGQLITGQRDLPVTATSVQIIRPSGLPFHVGQVKGALRIDYVLQDPVLGEDIAASLTVDLDNARGLETWPHLLAADAGLPSEDDEQHDDGTVLHSSGHAIEILEWPGNAPLPKSVTIDQDCEVIAVQLHVGVQSRAAQEVERQAREEATRIAEEDRRRQEAERVAQKAQEAASRRFGEETQRLLDRLIPSERVAVVHDVAAVPSNPDLWSRSTKGNPTIAVWTGADKYQLTVQPDAYKPGQWIGLLFRDEVKLQTVKGHYSAGNVVPPLIARTQEAIRTAH